VNHRTWLTMAVERARCGLRREVQAMLEAFASAKLVLPLARRLAGFADGERRQVNGALQLTPQLLSREDGCLMLPAFTWEEPISRFAKDWRTDGGPLQTCTLPALAVLDLADRIVDGTRVVVLVLDPGASSQLGLRRAEIVSLREGRALPLIEYTRALDLPPVFAEQGPWGVLVRAVERTFAGRSEVLSYRVERWFDPERDVEPRLVITARVTPEANQRLLVDTISVAIHDYIHPDRAAEVTFETASK
jgi:hypothetical protein